MRWVFSGTDHWAEVAEAKAHLDRGRPDLTVRTVARIHDESPGAGEALTLAGKALLAQGNIPSARRALERALKVQPRQAEAAKMLASIYLARGDGTRGLELLQRSAELDPRDFRPWFAMGKVYHDLGEYDKAADAYTQALKRSPPPAEARDSRIGRIRALLDDNRAEQAEPYMSDALNESPDDVKLLGLAARNARELGRNAEAVRLIERALKADADNVDALLTRARLHNLARRLDDELADLEHVLRVNPNHLAALQLLVQVRTRLNQPELAAEAKTRWTATKERLAMMDRLVRDITQRPEDPELRYRMGQAALEGKMYTLADQCFQAALDVSPKYKPARDALQKLRTDPDIAKQRTREQQAALASGSPHP
jgi:tetratricopeptide (TPR) repeat protein